MVSLSIPPAILKIARHACHRSHCPALWQRVYQKGYDPLHPSLFSRHRLFYHPVPDSYLLPYVALLDKFSPDYPHSTALLAGSSAIRPARSRSISGWKRDLSVSLRVAFMRSSRRRRDLTSNSSSGVHCVRVMDCAVPSSSPSR